MWRCFHCDEAFTDRAAACEHFGESRVGVPLCQEPRDVQEALRRTRIAENESLRMADSLGQERTENERLAHLLASWERQFGTTDPRAAWNRLDSMEGRALAAEARVAELEAALRAVAARLDQPVFRGDEKAGSAATARILRADIRSALVVAISAIDAARNAPIAGIGLPANKTAASNEVPK